MKTTKRTEFTLKDIGVIVDATCYSAEHLNRRVIDFATQYCGFVSTNEVPIDEESYPEYLQEECDKAVEELNSLTTPPYCFFQIEDNCLFLAPSVEAAKENIHDGGDFISSRKEEYPPADYRGEWLHVNDHGNATLYWREDNGQDTEIWSVV